MSHDSLPKSSLIYVLQSLIPYSRPNIKLAFKPNLFFNDLEKIAQRKRQTLRNSYYKAQKAGLIEVDSHGTPRLTDKGQSKLNRFKPALLGQDAKMMVIFDIPEDEAWKRQRLRRLLRHLRFRQIQKSVWISDYDHRELLKAEITRYKLRKYVRIYEAAPLNYQ